MDNKVGYYNGMKVIEDSSMTKPITSIRRKTLKERWFNSPWKPWEGEKTVITHVPSEEVLFIRQPGPLPGWPDDLTGQPDTIVAHPETVKALMSSKELGSQK